MSAAETQAPPNGALAGPEQAHTDPPMAQAAAPAPQATTLFGTDDPAEALRRAQKAAASLKEALASPNFTSNIRGRKHVKVEGWLLVGSMFGATPVLDWTRPISEPAKGWEARFQVQLLDGRIIGAGEAMCDRNESKWARSDDYAVRSMAQTRATSKALASVFRFLVTLAGFSGTPAEEMPTNGGGFEEGAVQQSPASTGPLIPHGRVEQIEGGFRALGLKMGQIGSLLASCGINGLRANSAKAIKERLGSLTLEEADRLEAAMNRLAQDAEAEQSQDGGEATDG